MNNEVIDLPIGTIVKPKNENREIMILGYRIKKGSKIYDYCGVNYPEGMIKKNNVALLNKGDIEKVLFEGYKNELFADYIKLVNDQEFIDNLLGEVNNE